MPVVVTAFDGLVGDSDPGTPFMRALKRQQEYQEEMDRLAQGGADYSGREEWRRLMRLCGRERPPVCNIDD